jgi:hypothetical protein
MAPHSSDDPSLRGLDVWVGRVENGSGTVVNSGIIRSLTGSITVAGKRITQAGALESSTSVALNGRIDLLASYGAVANPNFDGSFLNQFTGVAEFMPGSVTRVVPQVDGKRIPGTSLPERSQVNIEGLAVHFGPGSILTAPSGEVNIRAGTWPYRDLEGNGTIFDANGLVEPGLANYYEGGRQKFFHDRGQVYFDRGALVDVSGSTTAFVPLSQSVVEVTLRKMRRDEVPLPFSEALVPGRAAYQNSIRAPDRPDLRRLVRRARRLNMAYAHSFQTKPSASLSASAAMMPLRTAPSSVAG